MDGLDLAASAAIAGLLIAAVVIFVFFPGRAVNKAAIADPYGRATMLQAMPPAVEAQAKRIKGMLAAGDNPGEVAPLIKAALAKYPYGGEFYMLLGDVHMREEDPVGAVLEYRKAVELDPDFADKTSRAYQGGKIRVAIKGAKRIVAEALAHDPGKQDARMKKARSDIYYLKGRLAGSCD